MDLRRGPGLHLDPGEVLLQGPYQVQVVGEGPFGVVARREVDFREPRLVALLYPGHHLVHVPVPGPFLAEAPLEGAEGAPHVADVGLGDADGVDEVGLVPVLPLADQVGEAHEGGKVLGLVEDEAVLKGKPFPFHHLLGDGDEAGVPDASHAPESTPLQGA